MRQNLKSARKAAGLNEIPTCELVEELKKRQGVSWHIIGPNAEITVHEEGPIVVLAVFD